MNEEIIPLVTPEEMLNITSQDMEEMKKKVEEALSTLPELIAIEPPPIPEE